MNQLIQCFQGLRNQTTDNRQYSVTVRKFALTLNFYSPRAYRYVRQKFQNNLPHPRTLSKWYLESECNGEPGTLTEAMKSLRSLAENLKREGKQLVGSLALDEMSIRRHVEYVQQERRFSGFIHCGKPSSDGSLPVANQVLVFMFTALNFETSIPIAYYAITSLDQYEKRDLIVKMITELHAIGIKLVNITFDGLITNRGACELLGACFDYHNIIPYIIHPVDGSRVYISLDSCHMLKLIRNALGDLGSINDPTCGSILWSYFHELETFRTESNFVTHRLNKRHLQYARNRMNVRLAAETFSNSVASTMNHLREIGIENFQSSGSTINFVRRINDLFDTTNSKRIRSDNPFKSAINQNNAAQIFDFFDEMDIYIRRLKFKRKLCVNSKRRTGFIGFLVNMMTIRQLYNILVPTGVLESLPTFYLSQDPLESFYSRVRSQHGANDNPTIQQFKSAIRKLLFYNEISSTEFSNCEDNLNILTVSSAKPSRLTNHQPQFENDIFQFEGETHTQEDDDEFLANEALRIEEQMPHSREETTIAFFAGCVEKNIQSKRTGCIHCRSAFDENGKIEGAFIENSRTQRPCISTYLICKEAHNYVNESKGKVDFDYKAIVNSTLNAIRNFDLFRQTNFVHQDGSYHKLGFITEIIDEYIRIYATYIERNITLEQQKIMLRNRNKRTTIFYGQ